MQGFIRRAVCLALPALTASMLAAPTAHAAKVFGNVFDDYDANGKADFGLTGTALDTGVAGVKVTAYDAAGQAVATTTSSATGLYVLDAPDAKVRIEVTVPAGYQYSRELNGLRSAEQFVDASSPQFGVDFGIQRPGEYSVDNPQIYWPMSSVGSVGGPNANADGIRGMSYLTTPPTGTSWAAQPSKQVLASFGQVGTIFGLGEDQRTGDLYAGAYYKRYAGLTSDGPGAIFKVTQSGQVSLFANLPAGNDGHPASTDINEWIGAAPAHRDMSWDLVGKVGLGSVKVDPANENVYTVDLANKRLYRLPLSGGPAASTPVPVPSGVDPANWRPFAIGFDLRDGTMYVGGVDSQETGQDASALKAIVYRVGDPAGTPTFTQVVSVPLDFNRLVAPAAPGGLESPFSSNWTPWPTAASIAPALSPIDASRGVGADRGNGHGPGFVGEHSYPLVSAISFDADGSMQLGFRDLKGDMAGNNIPGEAYNGTIHTQADLLRLCPNGGGGWTLENGGSCGSQTGFGTGLLGAVGPGDGYFYDPTITWGAMAGYQGGQLQIPGFTEVVSTDTDPSQPSTNEDGLIWHVNSNGAQSRTLSNRAISTTDQTGGFGKANGLGDLVAYTKQPPLQIGNRVWIDTNKDGIQGADEPPIAGLTIELVDASGNVVDTTTTDSIGDYVFTIEPGTAYTLRIPLNQPQLAGLVPTTAGAGSNRGIDSDGRTSGGYLVASVGPHGRGMNDHTFDFGFTRSSPAPSGSPPPPPPAPGAPRLTLVKRANHRTVRPGRTVRYTLVVRNVGTATARNARLCDTLPWHLSLVTRGGGALNGGRLCWRIPSLAAGRSLTRSFLVRVDGNAPAGRITNHASVGHARAHRTIRVPRQQVTPVRGEHVTG